ncbi:MAG: amino acid ABC transporter substrate-binding protein, partial [Desulfobacterales bacterium]|nr:amino acid ABC transporter substrate-binding protein [Desulfobacterales bacterium]
MMKKIFWILFLFSGFIVSANAEQYLVLGTDLPPLMYEKDSQPQGFYVEILEAMIQTMKDVDIEIKFFPVPRLFKILSSPGNTLSLGVTRNEKREHLYKWVGPIYPRIFALYKLKNRTDLIVNSLADVRPYRIGVGRGYAAVDDLLNAGIPRKNIDEVDTDDLNIKKLFANRIDFVIMNDVMLAYRLAHEGYSWADIEQSHILNDKYQFWYAFNKELDDKVVQKFQAA